MSNSDCVRFYLSERHSRKRNWYLQRETKNVVQTETKLKWRNLKRLVKDVKREAQNYAGITGGEGNSNTLNWTHCGPQTHKEMHTDRQTGRDHWASLSTPYANQWIIQGGEGFSSQSAQPNPETPPFFFLLPSSTIRAPRHLAPDRSLAGSRKSQSSDAWIQWWNHSKAFANDYASFGHFSRTRSSFRGPGTVRNYICIWQSGGPRDLRPTPAFGAKA